MIELWIPITLFAAFMQNLRSALQKHLKGRLSTGGATYVRFLYACPLALAYLLAVHQLGGYGIPAVNGLFLLYCLLGGLCQILFTFLLVYLFSFRNFAVGTVYSKTEMIQVALLGLILLGDTISGAGVFAIALGMVGILGLAGLGVDGRVVGDVHRRTQMHPVAEEIHHALLVRGDQRVEQRIGHELRTAGGGGHGAAPGHGPAQPGRTSGAR